MLELVSTQRKFPLEMGRKETVGGKEQDEGEE